MAEIQNLFGWPEPEARDAGRPEHSPTDEKRSGVRLLTAIGRTNKEIAAALGISQPTLRKHYFQELSQRKVARLQLDLTLWSKLYEKVLAGDVSAMKEFGRRLEKHDVAELASSFGAPQRERKPKVEKLGKKEIAQMEAENAGADSDWGDDLLPGTRVN